GTFTDVTEEAGVFFPDGRAMSAIATDLNNDGHLDIYVTNDATPNCYYVSNGKGKFAEEAMMWGVAFGEGGQGASSMGPVVGDVDGNELLDLFIPDMGYNCLLVNRGNGFIDVTAPTNLAVICGQYTGWGGILFDYDNDGWLDAFVANGNAHHEYTEEDVLARNNGKGKFIDVAVHSGEYFHEKYVCRGASYADYDNDGDLDLLINVLNGPAKLLRNDGGNRNNWLLVSPKLPATKMIAIGSRVTVTVGDAKQIREVVGVTGYLSQSDLRAHFGLGKADKADLVEIRWPGGRTTTLRNVKADQMLEVIQPND
ncbi:MAG: CRTAC1 family protein, partial [Phycisphaerales bacterium]